MGFVLVIFISKVLEDLVGLFDYIDMVLDIVDYDINKLCLVVFDLVILSVKKWLMFG